MKVFNIAINEIKVISRDRKGMFMMIVWPIILIAVLGFSLKSAFSSYNPFKDTKVVYTMKENTESKKVFEEALKIIKHQGIEVYKERDENLAKEKLQDKEYDCYINFHKDGTKIDFYKNNKYSVQGSVIEIIINSFVKKYNTVVEVYKINPRVIERDDLNKSKNYVDVKSLEGKRNPSSLEYYAVTMTIMIILYSSLSANDSFGSEYTRNTIVRLGTSPLKKHEIFIGKVIGIILITIVQILCILLFSKYVLNVYWGKNEPIILLVLLSEIIMTVFFGVGTIYLLKKENIASAFLNSIIPFITFFGGGYTPIGFEENKILETVYNFNPFAITKEAIFNSMFFNNSTLSYKAIAVNLSIALIFLIISSSKFIKGEVI